MQNVQKIPGGVPRLGNCWERKLLVRWQVTSETQRTQVELNPQILRNKIAKERCNRKTLFLEELADTLKLIVMSLSDKDNKVLHELVVIRRRSSPWNLGIESTTLRSL